VILSVHQPRYSIFKLFDQLVLMDEGEMGFAGSPQQAIDFFASMGYVCEQYNNPADFFLDILIVEQRNLSAHQHIGFLLSSSSSSFCVCLPFAGSLSHFEKKKNLFCFSFFFFFDTLETVPSKFRQSNLYQELQQKVNKIHNNPVLEQGEKDEKESPYATSFFHQFIVISKRTILNIFRNPALSVLQLVCLSLPFSPFFSLI